MCRAVSQQKRFVFNTAVPITSASDQGEKLDRPDRRRPRLALLVLARCAPQSQSSSNPRPAPEGSSMRAIFKMHASLGCAIRSDLDRAHEFAYERAGFIECRAAEIQNGIMLLAQSYQPIADNNYLRDSSVGARINGSAIRAAMQVSLSKGVGMFHVHAHDHFGIPKPSITDAEESNKFVPDFFNVTPSVPHGIIILSKDQAFGLCWLGKEREPVRFDMIMVSGAPIRLVDIRL